MRCFQNYLKCSNWVSRSKFTAKNNLIHRGIYIYAVQRIIWQYFWSTWNPVDLRRQYIRQIQERQKSLLLCHSFTSCPLLPSSEISMISYWNDLIVLGIKFLDYTFFVKIMYPIADLSWWFSVIWWDLGVDL